MIVIHGGAWYGGDKADGYAALLRRDFAKRGYATVSVNYRQGLFNTDREIDCALLSGLYHLLIKTRGHRRGYSFLKI